jgi:hypothetical protein
MSTNTVYCLKFWNTCHRNQLCVRGKIANSLEILANFKKKFTRKTPERQITFDSSFYESNEIDEEIIEYSKIA